MNARSRTSAGDHKRSAMATFLGQIRESIFSALTYSDHIVDSPPRMRCFSSGALSNLAASGWRSQISRNQSEKATLVLNVTRTSLRILAFAARIKKSKRAKVLFARLQLRRCNIYWLIPPQQRAMPKTAAESRYINLVTVNWIGNHPIRPLEIEARNA